MFMWLRWQRRHSTTLLYIFEGKLCGERISDGGDNWYFENYTIGM